MNNKEYYIPELEEVSIGFEIELRNIENAQWGKYIITKNDLLSSTHNEESAICYIFTNNQIRTKYLDKKDLEELGWEHNQRFEYAEEFCKGVNYKLIIYNENINGKSMTIYCRGGLEFFPIFTGTIKNKNEFKKLMKQLRIC